MKRFTSSLFFVCSLHLLICLTVFSQNSQNKPVSVKFDEYSEESGANLNLLAEKTKRFAEYLQKLPKTTKGVIIYYISVREAGCCPKNKSVSEQRNDYVLSLLAKKYKMPSARIVSKGSAYRYFSELEFWIYPRDSNFPFETPNAVSDYFCPKIWIEGNEIITDKTKPSVFTAYYAGTDGEITFEWSVSAGKIIKGQRTGVVEIDLSETNSKEIEITLKLNNCCFEMLCAPATFKAKIQN